MAAIVAHWVSFQCLAQGEPRAPGRDITSNTGALSPEQVSVVKAYAEYWCKQLAAQSSSPEDVQGARNQLLRPLAAINAPQPPFRYEYSGFVTDLLDPVFTSGSLHAATNAANVLSQLGTRSALMLLVNKCGHAQIPWQARQAAAQGSATAIRAAGLQPKEVQDAVRRLRDAARNEQNQYILRYQLEAMLAAAEHPSLAPADREKIRTEDLVDAVGAVIARIEKDPQQPSPLFESLHATVFRLFRLLIDNALGPQEPRALGVKIGPVLVKGLDLARQQWEDAHADPQLDQAYSNFIKGTEDFLKRIDAHVRVGSQERPQTQLQGAWDGGKKEQFVADTKRWMDVVTQPPYSTK